MPKTAQAASSPQPPPTLGSPRGKVLRTEEGDTYPFIERAYEPPRVLPLHEARLDKDALRSPEGVVTSLTSALRNLDWPWFLSLWEPDSRDYILSVMAQDDATPARRLAEWRRTYVGKDFHITRRIDMSGYVLLSVAPTDGDPEVWARMPPLTLIRGDDRRWWLSHALRAHPVLAMGLGLKKVTVTDRVGMP